jgi:hypothetical protein
VARLFDNASSQFLRNATTPITAVPLTIVAWVRPDEAITQSVFSIGDTGSNVHYFSLDLNASHAALAQTRDASGLVTATAGTTGTINTWFHVAAVFSAINSRAAYTNGGAVGTNATSRTPVGVDAMGIGRLERSSPTQLFSGRIAEAALWNVALSAGEIAALASGISPPYIQPASLVGYWPLWGLHSPEIDLTVGNRQMTVTGATAADHAPVTPFSSRIWGTAPFLGDAATAARQMMHYKRLRAL